MVSWKFGTYNKHFWRLPCVMATSTRPGPLDTDEELDTRRSCSLNRNDRFRQRIRSPSPAARGQCSYSRLSAMRENSIFKKYLDKDSSEKCEESAVESVTPRDRVNRLRERSGKSPAPDTSGDAINSGTAGVQRADTEPCLKTRIPRTSQDLSTRLRRTETDPCMGRKTPSSIPPRPVSVRRSETERCKPSSPEPNRLSSAKPGLHRKDSALGFSRAGGSGKPTESRVLGDRQPETDRYRSTKRFDTNRDTNVIRTSQRTREDKNPGQRSIPPNPAGPNRSTTDKRKESIAQMSCEPKTSLTNMTPDPKCEDKPSRVARTNDPRTSIPRTRSSISQMENNRSKTDKSKESIGQMSCEPKTSLSSMTPDPKCEDKPSRVVRTNDLSTSFPRTRSSISQMENISDSEPPPMARTSSVGRSRSSQRAGSREDRRQRYRRSLEFFAEAKDKLTAESLKGNNSCSGSAIDHVQTDRPGEINIKPDKHGKGNNSATHPNRLVRCGSVESLARMFQQEDSAKDSSSVNTPRDSRKDVPRSHTPSFDEFKKRLRIPSFGEFRKQRDRDRPETDKDDGPGSARPSTGSGSSLVRCQSTPSVLSSVARTGGSNAPTSSRVVRSRSAVGSAVVPQVGAESPGVCLSKGIRIKPAYIRPTSDAPDKEEVSDMELDNSLDDNVIMAELAKDSDGMDAPVTSDNSCVKKMDSDGNFWIVVPPEETDSNTYHYSGRSSSLGDNPGVLRKPPIPRSDRTEQGDDSDTQKAVYRSTSDVSDLALSSGRKRKERKDRLYKSDPFSGKDKSPSVSESAEASLLPGTSCASLDAASSCTSVFSLDELPEDVTDSESGRGSRRNRGSNVSGYSTDSDLIGQEVPRDVRSDAVKRAISYTDLRHQSRDVSPQRPTALSNKLIVSQCNDCGKEAEIVTSGLCKKCDSKKTERKRTLLEIVDTEATYRRDLKILKEEFYLPIKSAGLLSPDQLSGVFLNVDELLQVNYDFLQQLRTLVKTSTESDLSSEEMTVKTGELFLKASSQFLAFETYCVNQASAASLLENYERENELLRVFLQVSQTENLTLRKMNLKSFLVIPIQRITKYPLLLSRLYKATPGNHKGREDIKEASDRIGDILEHINGKTQSSGMATVKIRRRRTESKNCSMLERFELIKVSQELLGWSRMDVSDVFVGKLHLAQPSDHTWAVKKGRTLKFSPVFAVVLSQGKSSRQTTSDKRMYPRPTAVKHAALVLIREKNDKYLPLREPLMLHQCVLAVDADHPQVFEIQEWNKECYILKAEEASETEQWVQYLKQYWIDLSVWRRRRNALANIMIRQT